MMKNTMRLILAFFLLSTLVLSLSAQDIRDVRIKLVADEEFRADPQWRTTAANVVRLVSEEFESLFGIRLTLEEIDEWVSDNSIMSLPALMDDLDARVPKGRADILVAVTAQTFLQRGYRGYSLFFESIILLEYDDSLSALIKTLRHEIAHLFGAVHVADPDSVMDFFIQGKDFDRLNQEVIRLNKNRRFNEPGFPLPKEKWRPSIVWYQSICDDIEDAKTRGRIRGHLEPGIKGMIDENGRRDYRGLEDAHVFLAQIHLAAGEYDRAIARCATALKTNPDNLEAHNIQGICYRKQGHFAEAIGKYRQILRRKPGWAKILYNLGIAYARAGEPDRAVQAYQMALAKKPNFAEAHNNLGEVYLETDKAGEAKKEFMIAVALNPRFALARANLGEVYFQQGDYQKSMDEVRNALQIQPELAPGLNVLGNLYFREKRLADALQVYKRAVDSDPLFAKAYTNLGRCCAELGRWTEAVAYLNSAVEIDPQAAEAHADLGYCLLKTGKTERALSSLRRAHELGHREAPSFLNLSNALLKSGKIEKALEAALRCVKIDPAYGSGHGHLAMLYYRKGMFPKARAHVKLAQDAGFQVDPEFLEMLSKK